MTLHQHEIAEANHRILDPLTLEHIRLLGEVCRVTEGTRVLDLACGKGEMLCRWSAWFGATGVGVDLSEVFLAAARARAEALDVAGRLTFHQGDAGAYPVEAGAYDVAACVGATWIGGGLAGTVALLRRGLGPDGLVVVGEPFWNEAPPADALAAFGFAPDDYVSLAGTAARLADAGLELVEMVLADGASWDRYEAAHWRTISDWLRAHPADLDHAGMRQFLDRDRETYLTWGRRYMGWGVFVARPR